jgi:2-aminobenzoate-CoA ligase
VSAGLAPHVIDHYPSQAAAAAHCLVAPELQPDYLELPGHTIPAQASVADFMVDAHVREGRGDLVAALHAESGRAFTFAQLADFSDRMASALVAIGVRPGDRVAFRSPNVPEVLIAASAAWKAGAAVVPTPVQAPPDELRHFLRDTGARVLLVFGRADVTAGVAEAVAGTEVEHVLAFGPDGDGGQFPDWSELLPDPEAGGHQLPAVASDGVAVLWHTGGTTGRPKACYHTHRRYLLGGFALGAAIGTQPGERWAAAAPVGHALGFLHHTSYAPLHGATAVFVETFQRPESMLAAVADHGVHTLTAITASWARMLDVLDGGGEYDLSSLERAYAMWQSASSSDVYDGWRARGVELLNNFGSTAFASWVLVPHAGDSPPRASLGRAAPGYEVRAVEIGADEPQPVPAGTAGRMAVKGPTGLTYWNRPDLQSRDVVDGWTYSDDLISFDADGNAAYLGRTDYLISTAGYKVPPGEVEEVLATHPAVAEVAVVAAPDPIRQEVVMAFVATEDGTEGSDELKRELQDLVKSRLAPYKYPRRIEFVDALPRDHVGKVRHSVIKEWAGR